MFETFTTLVILSLLYLFFFRPGKTPPLDSPLAINRVGQFHAVLAPKLNLAQPLLENISLHLGEQGRLSGNTQPLYFKVSDKEVRAHGKDFYLLAATLRDGVLYFQATTPQNDGNDLDTIRAFSEAVLARHPVASAHTETTETALLEAIRIAANQRSCSLVPITG